MSKLEEIRERWTGVYATVASWWREPDGELVNMRCGDAGLFSAAPEDVSYLLGLVERLDRLAAAACDAQWVGPLTHGDEARHTALCEYDEAWKALDTYRREHGGER